MRSQPREGVLGGQLCLTNVHPVVFRTESNLSTIEPKSVSLDNAAEICLGND